MRARDKVTNGYYGFVQAGSCLGDRFELHLVRSREGKWDRRGRQGARARGWGRRMVANERGDRVLVRHLAGERVAGVSAGNGRG